MFKKHETIALGSSMISTSTILILSGFLIGLSVGQGTGNDISAYVMACGVAGLLAFIVFDAANARRQLELERRDREQVEDRLSKHVHGLHGPEGELLEDYSPADVQKPASEEHESAEHLVG